MYPSTGSMLGGTLLTIQGNYFDQTDSPVMVLVGGINWLFYAFFPIRHCGCIRLTMNVCFSQGSECSVQNVTDETIVCATPKYEWNNMTVFPGKNFA